MTVPLLLVWLAVSGPACASETDARLRARVLYWPGTGDFPTALDQLLDDHLQKASGLENESKDMRPALYSGSAAAFTFEGPISTASIPAPEAVGAAAREGERTVSAIESRLGAMIIEGAGAEKLLEAVLAMARDRSGKLFEADARRVEAKVSTVRAPDGSPLELAVLGDGRAAPRWTLGIVKRVRVRGPEGLFTVTTLARRLGGDAQIAGALRAELREPVPAVVLKIGGLSTLRKSANPVEPMLAALRAFEPLVVAPSWYDFEHGWDALAAFSRSGGVVLCGNLQAAPGAPELPCRPFHVAELGGVRVGFFSLLPARTLSGPLTARLARAGVSARMASDPVEAGNELSKALRGKADLVVGIQQFTTPGEARKVRHDVDDVDVWWDSESHRNDEPARLKTTLDLSGWRLRGRDRREALVVGGPAFSYGELTAEFARSEAGLEPVRLVDEPGPSGPDLPGDPDFPSFEARFIVDVTEKTDPLLPDPLSLWPGMKRPDHYEPLETWNLAAEILRRHAGAEIGLLKEGMGIGGAGGEPGAKRVGYVFDSDERVVVLRLSGRALRSIAERLSDEKAPADDHSRRDLSRLALAGAGLDRRGLARGFPLRDDEPYAVASTDGLLEETQELPELVSARVEKREEKLQDVVAGWLRGRRERLEAEEAREREAGLPARARREYEAEVRAMIEGTVAPKPLWRLHLRRLSLQFSNTDATNTGPFRFVRNARIRSTSQLLLQSEAALFSELFWGRFRWDAGVSAEYGRVTLRPQASPRVENETADVWKLQTELRHQTGTLGRGPFRYSVGPYLNLSYDTEFTEPPDIPKRRLLQAGSGLKLFEGAVLQDLFAGAVLDADYSGAKRDTEWGVEGGARLSATLRGTPARVEGQARYRHFFPTALDTADDLATELEASLRVSLPLVGELRLSPFVSFFRFTSKTTPDVGSNLLVGVSLDYSRLWKPFR